MGAAQRSATGVSGWLDDDTRRVGGVARHLAHRFGTHRAVARVAFCAVALAGGVGIVAYGLVWLLIAGRKQPQRREPTTRCDLGVACAAAATVAASTSLMPWLPSALLWLVVLAMMGAAIAAAPDLDRHHDVALRIAPVRAAAGAVLLVAAAATALAGTADLRVLWQGLLTAIALVIGLWIVVGPWLGKLAAAATHERFERIRAEERADIAAHLHDSVLQTLTLIQNRANESQVVAALAHQQERELRRWLYGSAFVESDDDRTLRSAIGRLAAEIEEQYLVAVESIVVGDAPMTSRATAILGAAREALINAAKFSGSNLISLFAEASDDEISVFVRDRGRGFVPEAVAQDRRGISESIVGRVERVGGAVTLRSRPGSGTEVALTVRTPHGGGTDRPVPDDGSSQSA